MTVFRRVSSPLFGKVTSIVSAPRTITRNPGVPLPLTSKVASEAGMLATVHAQVCTLFENSKNSIIYGDLNLFLASRLILVENGPSFHGKK